MIANPSELQLNSFALLQSHYEFVPSKKLIREPDKIFKSYEIDIDFSHKENEDGSMSVFTKIAVNQNEKSMPGYKLFVEGTAIFSLDKTIELKELEEKNLKYYSTVSILIGYLRSTLISLTSSSPLGIYILPPINMTDLFQKKSDKSQQ